MLRKINYVALILLLSGCSTTAFFKTSDSFDINSPEQRNITKSDTARIEIYCLDQIDRQYKIIGKVIASADAGESADRPVRLLKEQAAELGADAIINFRLLFITGQWDTGIKASGTAVKFTGK